jgi:NAD-dependent SIR2 family protein deacetylase
MVSALCQFIEDHPRLFVLTGAGCSTDSGIPDYRDRCGEWKRREPICFRDFADSAAARRRYWARSMLGWPRIWKAAPNSAHYILTHWQRCGRIGKLVTQNVDGLHQRAGSHDVVDLHGRLDAVQCMDCGQRCDRNSYQRELEGRNDASQWSGATAPDGDADLDDEDLSAFDVPACRRCGGVVKPSVVFFGETVPHERVALAYRALHECDAVLVVGSSLMVFSGYRFCRAAAEYHKPIAALNIGRTRADSILTLKVDAACSVILLAVSAELSGSALTPPRSPYRGASVKSS